MYTFKLKFEADCVVQLVKLRNIAAPKENESSMAAPPLYKMTLTDGHAHCNAILIGEINKLKYIMLCCSLKYLKRKCFLTV